MTNDTRHELPGQTPRRGAGFGLERPRSLGLDVLVRKGLPCLPPLCCSPTPCQGLADDSICTGRFFNGSCKKKKREDLTAYLPLLACTHKGSRLTFASRREFGFRQREVSASPTGSALVLRFVGADAGFLQAFSWEGTNAAEAFGSLCCLELRAEPLVTGTVGRVPRLSPLTIEGAA